MKLTFLGAAHEVTGSCYYLEACGQKILIDCGLEQGRDIFENQPLPVSARDIDMVLLTHAHIDHSGRLPLLAKEGFDGQIFATEGTARLCEIMLMDSAHIQESEAEWRSRKNERAGKPKVQPLYTSEDASNALHCFVGVPYGETRRIAEGIQIRFVDAGHLLGSASIEIWLQEGGIEKKIVFSGDIGNESQPLIKDPTYLQEADYVVMESTYGDRTHDRPADYTKALAAVLQETFDRGGNVVIPSFAVGRTQEMLYFIRQIKQDKLVRGHDGFEVYVDSPLAVDATHVFMERMYSDFDEQAEELVRSGINPISFDGLKVAVTQEDSRFINEDPRPKVILSASGMCDAGRIRHHLKHNLYRSDSTILFVGYQSEGTLGRSLVEGAEHVKLFGEEITVKAKVRVLPGISGHADCIGLMRWISAFDRQKPLKVFVTHGEDKVTEIFADKIEQTLHIPAYAPYSGTQIDLSDGSLLYEAVPIPVKKETAGTVPAAKSGAQRELEEAAGQLQQFIQGSAGLPNADKKRLAAQIRALLGKWEG